jgi:hypothetical protein
MWLRNLTFIAFVLAGAAALLGGMAPVRFQPRVSSPVAADSPTPEYQTLVQAVNDAFRQQWRAANVTPVQPAPELAVARRMALALCGTVPSLEEIRRLEAEPRDRWQEAWLTRLFHDRRFADYFAERLARIYVGTEDGPFLIFRRRRLVSWLSDELLRNRPYDELVRELIAGEGLWTDRPGTNFITVTIEPDKNEPNPERLAARVARAFLGVRLDCAQCHDHPFQPWKQADFQGLAAYFGQVHPGLTGVHDGDGEFQAAKGKAGAPRIVEPHVPFQPELLPGEGNRRSQLARWVTDPRNPALARTTVNRVWALLFGRPLVEPVDDLPSAGEPPRVLKLLADDFAVHSYDLQRLIRVIAATEVFQLDSAGTPEPTDLHEKLWAAFPLTRLRPEQVAGALFQTASLETIDRSSHILVRIFNAIGENEFVKRYGDAGEDEFDRRTGTIPQRLLLMNGQLVSSKTEEGLFPAVFRISFLAPDDRSAVEAAYLTVLTRRPTDEEAAHFETSLAGTQGNERRQRMSDLFWTLLNSTEFSWNH